ncbi:hypothetical protein C8Q73DRAFT_708357 [Cubamyces lactineus]|nr:hypothetical protein C8Q73DRAFT_708357 [Cubamyces lactineus]
MVGMSVARLVARSSMRPHDQAARPYNTGVKNVPFFSLDTSRTMATVHSEEHETCNYVGNEAQEWMADSVYLSYALIVAQAISATGAAEKASSSD